MDKYEEKQKIIAEYLLGATSTRKLAIKYGYGHVTISRWIMAHQRKPKNQPLKFSKAIMESDGPMPTNVRALQEALRLSQLKVELLEAMIDISDEQFGTDIRKKAGTRQS
jgi:transposase-like protein